MANGRLVFFDTPTAQALFLGGKDVYTSMGYRPGVSQQQLETVKPHAAPGAEAVTGKQAADER